MPMSIFWASGFHVCELSCPAIEAQQAVICNAGVDYVPPYAACASGFVASTTSNSSRNASASEDSYYFVGSVDF